MAERRHMYNENDDKTSSSSDSSPVPNTLPPPLSSGIFTCQASIETDQRVPTFNLPSLRRNTYYKNADQSSSSSDSSPVPNSPPPPKIPLSSSSGVFTYQASTETGALVLEMLHCTDQRMPTIHTGTQGASRFDQHSDSGSICEMPITVTAPLRDLAEFLNKNQAVDSKKITTNQLERRLHEGSDVSSEKVKCEPETHGKERNYWKQRALSAERMLQLTSILSFCKIKDFFLLKVVSQGCEEAVFQAKCIKGGLAPFEGMVFTIKVLFEQSSSAKDCNYREYDILKCLAPHENVVSPYTHFSDQMDPEKFCDLFPEVAERAQTPSYFLVFEDHTVTLEDVASKARKEGQLTARKVMDWTLQLLTGVEHLLKHFVVHRDMKLSNVLVSEKGILKICNFGSSVQLGSQNPPFSLGSVGGNLTGMTQVPNSPVNCSNQDMSAVAKMIYEICGISDFSGRHEDIPQLCIVDERGSVEHGTPCPDLPTAFAALVKSLLHCEPCQKPFINTAISQLKDIMKVLHEEE
eukprot:m.8473 g.8473  ORF g.8473 m.8473 type:complete len:521 (+) comp20614_c0_seq2:56-1618(+)